MKLKLKLKLKHDAGREGSLVTQLHFKLLAEAGQELPPSSCYTAVTGGLLAAEY